MKGIIIAGVFVLFVAVILYHVIILHKTTGGLIGSIATITHNTFCSLKSWILSRFAQTWVLITLLACGI